ncbi:MAG: nickel-type superoxide dismutase maturation protease [Candidatus Limnocylindrales bacterium]
MRRLVTAIGLTAGLATVAAAVRLAARSWRHRVAVEGGSMMPGLAPGDWVLVDPAAYRRHRPQPGHVVVLPDPREPRRVLVKRVTQVLGDGRLEVRGDAPAASTDSRTFGPVAETTVEGRAWARYWPLARVGRVR